MCTKPCLSSHFFSSMLARNSTCSKSLISPLATPVGSIKVCRGWEQWFFMIWDLFQLGILTVCSSAINGLWKKKRLHVYLSLSDLENVTYRRGKTETEREKVARQVLKLEQPHVERQLNFHFTEGKVNHLDIFVPLQREIISEQLLIDNKAHL